MPELRPGETRHVSLVDVLDRVLGKGAVIAGDVTIAVADVDLIQLDLRVVLGAVDALGRLTRIGPLMGRSDERTARWNVDEPGLGVGPRPLPAPGSEARRSP